MKKFLFLMIFILLLGSPVFADDSTEDGIFQKIVDDGISFFAPLTGQVIHVEDETFVIGIGYLGGVREGMRMNVFREGDEFFHPVTGEPLGKIETEVGAIEIVHVYENESTAKVIGGDIQVDDKVRISRGTPIILFYQTKGVDWALGDELFRTFKRSGRFEVLETGLDADDIEVMLREVNERDAEFGVFLRQLKIDGDTVLEVSFYRPDGTMFYINEVKLTKEQLEELKFGYSFLKDIDRTLRLSFEVPSSTDFITSCDMNGDGEKEIVLLIGSDIEVFKFDVDMKLLYHRSLGSASQAVWVDCEDLDNDERAEIVVSSVVEGGAEPGDESRPDIVSIVGKNGALSQVFSLKKGELINKYTTFGFLRVVKGKLYFQAYSDKEGYSGDVHTVDLNDGGKKSDKVFLPGGVNIYDFIPVVLHGDKGYLVLDDSAYINLYNSDGLRIWRSAEGMGGFLREFELPAPTVMVKGGKWYGKDRIVSYDGKLMVIKRNLITKNAKGLGFSSSGILGIGISGATVETQPLFEDIGGTMLDFTVMDDNLIVLIKPLLGIKAGNILKGKSPFKRNLYVFSLK